MLAHIFQPKRGFSHEQLYLRKTKVQHLINKLSKSKVKTEGKLRKDRVNAAERRNKKKKTIV